MDEKGDNERNKQKNISIGRGDLHNKPINFVQN